jgi:hypothetical protein
MTWCVVSAPLVAVVPATRDGKQAVAFDVLIAEGANPSLHVFAG